jgi:4-hydroxy-3-polyprenylbenzoate decarboxylase
MNRKDRGYRDLHDHIQALDDAGLLMTVDEEINKDTELHPLVRWQYRGGIREADRKAFLFNNIVDSRGRKYDIPVVVAAMAGSRAIYSIGMEAPVEVISEKWAAAIANPIEPAIVEDAPCHEIVLTGDDLVGEGNGLDALSIPISTPGFDSTPTLSATNCITRDPETLVQNMGTYRAGLKAPDRLAMRMATRVGGAGGYVHWKKYKARGEKMEIAIVLGCPPCVAYMGPQKLPIDLDELAVAGGLAGAPIRVVKAKTVDLMVPADSEIVLEGTIDPEVLEPEGPFGESHGHIALEEYNMPVQITAITRKKNPIIPSYISQVTPSESSIIRGVAYEPLFLNHLRNTLAIGSIKSVSLHEPLTSVLRVTILTFERGAARTEIWRALYGAASFKADFSKITIAVNEDIDPKNADALLWALAYRHNPIDDLVVLPHRGFGHGPVREHGGGEESTLLIDATMKGDMPPLALPTRTHMEHAKALWERMGLPPLNPESPWHGYSLGDWSDKWEQAAHNAVQSNYLANGEETLARQVRKPGFPPETSVRAIEKGWD